MIGKLKQFRDMREQGKKIQGALSTESTTVKEGGVTMTMDGNLQMTVVSIEDEMMRLEKKTKLEKDFKDAYSSALRKMQRVMASKMQEMGGIPGLK